MASKFHDLLAERSYLVADGATGTNLFGRGLEQLSARIVE